jgi:hypothetical protein
MFALLPALAVAPTPHLLRGDFDHDGKPDVAEISAAPGGGYDLVVRLGASKDRPLLIRHFADVRNLYLTKARAGRWRTWCGKGGGSTNDPCPRQWVRLYGDTLSFGTEETTEYVAIWTDGKFEVVQLSG